MTSWKGEKHSVSEFLTHGKLLFRRHNTNPPANNTYKMSKFPR